MPYRSQPLRAQPPDSASGGARPDDGLPRPTRAQRDAMLANIEHLREWREQERMKAEAAAANAPQGGSSLKDS
ncbi:MAG: hypothetical protein QM740_08265 [Acidovorax sp.]